MKFIDSLTKLNLSFEGTPVSQDERSRMLWELDQKFSELSENELVLVQEKNPLTFIFTFCWLLEHGHNPVALPGEFSEYQFKQVSQGLGFPSSVINGELSKSAYPFQAPFKHSYACLTSGTTGTPKLCFLKVDNAVKNAQAHCRSLSINQEDVVLQCLPVYHSYGLIAYLFSWFEIKFTLDLNMSFVGLRSLGKRNLKNTVLNISPAQLRFMLKEKAEAPHGIKLISVGGGSIDQESLNLFSEKMKGIKIYLTYGLTEAGPRVTTGLWNGHETGFIGEAIPGVQTRVLVGDEIRTEGVGKLLIKSETLKLNLEVHELLKEEYLITRDLVKIDTSGSIFFKTRDDDLINFGGISVYPIDIESVAKRHPDVLDAIVIKIPSKIYEEEPVLIVEPELDIESLREFMKDKLSVYQMPKKIMSINSLPRNSLNKVDRRALKDTLEKA